MDTATNSVLLVEDNPDDAMQILNAFNALGNGTLRVEHVENITAALTGEDYDVVLVGLRASNSDAMAELDQIVTALPQAMILALGRDLNPDSRQRAVRHGAVDYLSKSPSLVRWMPLVARYFLQAKTARNELRNAEVRSFALSEILPVAMLIADAEGECVYINAGYQKISGLTRDAAFGSQWSEVIHPEERQRVLAEWKAAIAGNLPFRSEYRILCSDNKVVWVRASASAMRDGENLLGYIQTLEDITESKLTDIMSRMTEEALHDERERLHVTLASISDAVLMVDMAGRVTYLNPMAENMTGWPLEEAKGMAFGDVFSIIDGVTGRPIENPLTLVLKEDHPVSLAMNAVLVRRDGSEFGIEDQACPLHDSGGDIIGAVVVFHDVSASRSMTQKMAHMAQHDFLTDLPNRMLLIDRLKRAIGLAQRHHQQVALMFLDLDYFKHINDSLGHAVGDKLLQSVATRLAACVRSTDTVCRQGGDEFVVLLAELEHLQDASHIAEKLLSSIAAPHEVDGNELHISLSIGISIFPDDGADADTLMQNADTAMYFAKACGRNNYQFFTPDMNARAVQRMSVENKLRHALQHGEFVLHYQPQIKLADGALSGSEALIRWHQPEHGIILPAQFVAIAEECGLIVPIGHWVLREACRQVKAWLDAGLPVVPVAVNISAAEFRSKGFLDGVAGILKETGLAPHYLELEMTESILMHDTRSSSALLKALKSMGVALVIDDFGTGYSSMSYLKSFPIDALKIDQSFVRDLTTNEDDATIVSAMIGMGKNLKQRVIAEGVETFEQFEFLGARQCEVAQGSLFGDPLPADEFSRLLLQRS